MAAPNPSSSSSASGWINDVFISFRGPDTRKNFTDHLYRALDREGIKTFKDDVNLEMGELISEGLEEAIKESRISIIIFSPNFASSRWCLQELDFIIECWKKYGQKVIPVFLRGVEGSDVRHQKGSFGDPFRKHEQRFDRETVERWRSALKIAGELRGWNLKDFDGDEAKLIEKIVEDILKLLDKKPVEVPKDPIGLDTNARAENVLSGGIRWGVDVTALESVLASRRAEDVLSGEGKDVNALHTEAVVPSSGAQNVLPSRIHSMPENASYGGTLGGVDANALRTKRVIPYGAENVLYGGMRGGMDVNALRTARIIPYKAAENVLSGGIRGGMDVNALRTARIIPYKAAENVLSGGIRSRAEDVLSGGIRGGADTNALRNEAVMSSRALATAENVFTGGLRKQAAKNWNLFFFLFYFKKRSCRQGPKIPKMQKMLSLMGYGGSRGN